MDLYVRFEVRNAGLEMLWNWIDIVEREMELKTSFKGWFCTKDEIFLRNRVMKGGL